MRVILTSSNPKLLSPHLPPEYYKIIRSSKYCPVHQSTTIIDNTLINYRYADGDSVDSFSLAEITKQVPDAIFHILKYLIDPRDYLTSQDIPFEIQDHILTSVDVRLTSLIYRSRHPRIKIKNDTLYFILRKGR